MSKNLTRELINVLQPFVEQGHMVSAIPLEEKASFVICVGYNPTQEYLYKRLIFLFFHKINQLLFLILFNGHYIIHIYYLFFIYLLLRCEVSKAKQESRPNHIGIKHKVSSYIGVASSSDSTKFVSCDFDVETNGECHNSVLCDNFHRHMSNSTNFTRHSRIDPLDRQLSRQSDSPVFLFSERIVECAEIIQFEKYIMTENNMKENIENELSDSSESDSDDDKELVSKAQELEDQISSNKYLYDSHVEVTTIYLQMGDLSSMRAAFQRFHETFPLTPKLWLSWIQAEMKISSTSDEKAHIFKLFDKAVEDYLSIDVWVEYAQFSIGASDLSKTRSILEHGLNSAGLHVAKGSLLWDTLRELEHAHVQVNSEGSEEWKIQVNRLADVFKRQLSVPLLNMENTYHEWQEWFKSLPPGTVNPEPIEWGYKNALKVLEIYKPFEERLSIAETPESLEIYKEYIKVVKDPSTILCLYERAVVGLCLTAQLWEDYCRYAFKLGNIADQISARALRHCDWSVELWCARLRILEHLKRDENEIVKCFEQGLSHCCAMPHLDLWLSFVEYHVRNCEEREKLDKIFWQAEEQVSEEVDPTRKLSRWHARWLAKNGDVPAARKIWNNIVHGQQNKGTASVWLEYAGLERQYSEPNAVRAVFKKAMAACKDWPQYIAEEWLMFERQFGTLEDIIKCLDTCRSVVKAEPQHQQNETQRVEKVEENKEERNRKRKFEPRERSGHSKKSKFEPVIEHRPNLLHAPAKKPIEKDPKLTVFVSNLHPRVTERNLKELFPNAVNIDVVLDRKGKSRCFGYIQFGKEEEQLSALARDRVPIDGRPVFVSEIKPEKTERLPVFKYATGAEDNKLFVRGLPIAKTKEEIEEIFRLYDPVDVRVVTKRNGQSKGIAYVEFKTGEAARKALLELDQTTVEDEVISVAISAPPPKKAGGDTQSVGADAEAPVRHPRSRLQLPMMVPRSLQVKSGGKSEPSSNGGSAGVAPKKNSDFRDMLLKK